MSELTLKGIEPSDTVIIGANGMEREFKVTATAGGLGKGVTEKVKFDKEITVGDGKPWFMVGSGHMLHVMHSVGALRILRPDPPFSVEFTIAVGENCEAKGVAVVFEAHLYRTVEGKTLRVRIEEVRP